jgi:1-acyl-sn-glycerol-3-phosphate acyltransferase
MKKPATAKRPSKKKTPLAPKRQTLKRAPVLGSDPFRDLATALKPAKRAIQTPELQTPRAIKPSTAHETPRGRRAPPISHAQAPSLQSDPMAHAEAPSIQADPMAHADVPSTVEEGFVQRPQLASASPFAVLRGAASALKAALGFGSDSVELDAYGKDASLTQRLQPLAHLLYEKYWRVEVSGAQHVPSRACLIVANHAGAWPLDGPVAHLALSRERPELKKAYWLLEDQVFHAPMVGVLANRLGAVRANPENALRLLAEGHPVIVFPEGYQGLSKPISERHQLRRFGRGGYVKIALAAGVPIVPLAIVGAEESMPLLGTLPAKMLGLEHVPLTLPPLPIKWHLEFAKAVHVQSDAPDHRTEASMSYVEQKNDEVKATIERLMAGILQRRTSLF